MCWDCILYFILFYCLQNSSKHVNHSSQLKTVTKLFSYFHFFNIKMLPEKCYSVSKFATFYGILYFRRFHDIVFLFLFSIIQVLLWFNQLTNKERFCIDFIIAVQSFFFQSFSSSNWILGKIIYFRSSSILF